MSQEITVKFVKIEDLQEFVDIVSHCPYDVDLMSGRYTVNAKSMLGIISLDLSLPLKVIVYGDNCQSLMDKLKKFEYTQD